MIGWNKKEYDINKNWPANVNSTFNGGKTFENNLLIQINLYDNNQNKRQDIKKILETSHKQRIILNQIVYQVCIFLVYYLL